MKRIHKIFLIFSCSCLISSAAYAAQNQKYQEEQSAIELNTHDRHGNNQIIKTGNNISGERVLVNKIDAVVHGPQTTQLFCTLEHKRRGIDGRARQLPDLIADHLIYEDAVQMKVPIDKAVVQRHLDQILKMNGLKRGDEEKIYAQEGYTSEEGFEQFCILYAVNAMIEHKVMQNLFVSEEEVLAYYKAHPVIKKAKYLIQTAFVSYADDTPQSQNETQKKIDTYIKTGKNLDIIWSDAHWIREAEMAADMDPVKRMDIGSIIQQKQKNGIQLYRLVNKKAAHEVPLKKRYKKIVEILREPKFQQAFTNYKNSLFDRATIIYLQ